MAADSVAEPIAVVWKRLSSGFDAFPAPSGSITLMLEDIQARTGTLPGQLRLDAKHAKHSGSEAATCAGVEPIIAIPKREQCATKPVSPELDAWREGMKTDEGKRAYRARAALCKLSNVHLECHHGTAAVLVRGLAKVTCVALLGAIAADVLAHRRGVARVALEPRPHVQ